MSSSHSTIIYTSESDVDGSPCGIHMMIGYESKASEAAPHSPKHAPPSPVYASDSPDSEHIEDDPQEADPEDVPEEDPFEDKDEEV
ncbi:hypothetical protein Tco_0587119, partial [Tanacetum coccineum]